MTRKVIFLGAGASADAGYPITSNLYGDLKQECNGTKIVNYRDAWTRFDNSLNTIKKKYKDFETCDDLEYLLTVMSLLHGFHEKKSNNFLERLMDIIDENKLNEATESGHIAQAYAGAKRGFSECIGMYLGYKNYVLEPESYRYMCQFLENTLSNGGVVITTNYDLLAERALKDINLWHIRDGWGFPANFKRHFSYKATSIERLKKLSSKIFEKIKLLISQEDAESANYRASSSKVKVLKLHGSVGWLEMNNKIILATEYLQNILPAGSQGVKDAEYNPSLYTNKFMILPTFLKNYENKTLLEIWTQAAQAIQEAEEIHIIGFSLPTYDVNIKTLLLALRNNLSNQRCQAKVYLRKCDTEAQERWKNFLGEDNDVQMILIDSFKNYCEGLAT